MNNKILFSLIAFSPLIFRLSRYPGNEVSRTNIIILGLVFILFLSGEMTNRITRLFPVLCGLLFISLMAILNQHEPMSVNVFFQCMAVVIFSLSLIKLALTADKKTSETVINAMVIGGLIQSFFCLADFAFQNIFYEEIIIKLFKIERSTKSNVWFLNGETFQATGTLGGVARTAGYISVCSAGFWYRMGKNKRILSITGMFISFLAVLAVSSVLGIASFLAVHLFLLSRYLLDQFVKKNRELKVRVFNLICISSIFISFYSMLFLGSSLFQRLENERVGNWRKIIEIYKNEANKDGFVWIIGKGISWWQDIGWRVSGTKFFWEHNEQLSVLINFGILGTIIIWGGFFYALGVSERNKEDSIFKAAILASVVLSLGHFVFHQGTIAVVVMACFACLLRERES